MATAGISRLCGTIILTTTSGHCERSAAIKIRLFVATIILLLILVPSAYARYSGGTGESNDPYQIATAEDLMLLGETPEDYGKHFLLTADIDLAPNLPGRKAFDRAVISTFIGVFDGNHHTISRLTITGGNYLGLFGRLGSTARVSNLGIEDVEISGTGDYVGGLVGGNHGSILTSYSIGTIDGDSPVGGLVGSNTGTVTQCYATSWVSGYYRVGGLVGSNTGTVTQCHATSSVSGDYSVGGLVGRNTGEVTDSYGTGKISGERDVGGLVGSNWEYSPNLVAGLVERCYSTSAVNGDLRVGGLVGSNVYSEDWGDQGAVRQCFWDMQSSGQPTSDGGTGLATSQMQDIQTYRDAGWDLTGEIGNGTHETWQMPEEGGYPVLTAFNGYTPPELQGQGTMENPYLITDSMDLGAMTHYNPCAHYRLAAPIDLSGIRWCTSVIPWFDGTFDGNGHAIKYLHICSGMRYLGLFGQLGHSANISNLGLERLDINGSSYIGGLAGYNLGGHIVASYSSGSVSGTGYVGGLAGINAGSIVTSYSEGSVSGTGNGVGGLVGNNSSGSITTSYSSASVNEKSNIGGLVGGNNGSVNSSLWDIQTSGRATSAGGIGLTTAEMMDPQMLGLNGFADDPNWVLDACRDYPRLAWQGTPGSIIPEPNMDWLAGQGTTDNPYRIDTAEQLILLTKASILWDSHLVLGADIDLDPTLPGRYVFGQAVIPVFTGVFDGGGHVISHLMIQGRQNVGLFGSLTHEAEVRNLGIVDANITGSSWYVGGLVGSNGGTISNSYVSGSVTGTDDVGGLVGGNHGSIVASYSIGSVSGSGSDVGGLVGSNGSYTEPEGKIVACYSSGSVSGTGNYVGGLVGVNHASITDSYISGSVSGEEGHVGGLAGSNGGTISNSYSTGSIRGKERIGGLVGSNWIPFLSGHSIVGAITNSYSTGSVSGKELVGGLVGGNLQGSIVVSFWDIQTSGQVISAGGTGKTTIEMQTASTFLDAGWDFMDETANGTEDIWWILEGQDYPRLWWEESDL